MSEKKKTRFKKLSDVMPVPPAAEETVAEVNHKAQDFEQPAAEETPAVTANRQPPTANPTFLEKRIHTQMRLNPEYYTGKVQVYEKGEYGTQKLPHYKNVIITEHIEGVPREFEAIEINFTDIEGNQVYLDKGNHKGKPYVQLRWDIIPPKYDEGAKYKLPGGNGTRPFFPQWLKQWYESGMAYDNLVITEGAFKADVATKYNMPTVGLTSITHSADRNSTDELHTDILKIISRNFPKRITVLWDGDCRNIANGDFEKGLDLNRRPHNFYSQVRKIRERLRNDFYPGEIWFAHPLSELPGNPKGIDDLLLSVEKPMEVAEDLFSKHEGNTAYFHKINITVEITKLTKYFHQDGVDTFYNFHRARLKELPFTYDATKYKYDANDGKCILLFGKELKEYFRCGDKYYRQYNKMNAYGHYDKIIEQWDKAAIIEDFGKEQVRYITKYKSFVTIPDHFNHKQIIDNCYNRYYPFGHEADPDTNIQDFEKNSITFKYIRHVFGANEETGMHDHIEMFLDYFKLLYEKPMEKLPILCLVSTEKNTGKSTMLRWLRNIFTMNMVVIGNANLNDQFNATWSSKLLVAIDEALIEKRAILEMIKSLATESKIVVRRMQREGTQEDFFGKFIFTSNNIHNFVYADKHEDRFWVRYVPSYEATDVTFEKKLQDEIPQFLHYILQRSMHYSCSGRFWFPKKDYDTAALQKVVEASRNSTEKNLEEALEKEFSRPCNIKVKHLHFTKKDLIQLIRDNVGENEKLFNIRRCLINLGYPDQVSSISYTRTLTEYDNGKPEVKTTTENGRAYKFANAKGMEIFAPAKEKEKKPAKQLTIEGNGLIPEQDRNYLTGKEFEERRNPETESKGIDFKKKLKDHNPEDPFGTAGTKYDTK